MKIKVIKKFNVKEFTTAVNDHLANGWELFGEPTIETVVEKSTWDSKEYSRSHTVYHQTLKINE